MTVRKRIPLPVPSAAMAMVPNDDGPSRRIRWSVFAPVCVLGLLLVGAALGLSIMCDWAGIWIDFFLTFGATILLGAVLYVVQGSFLTTVRQQADRVIQNVETEATALEARIATQARRIDTLANEVTGDRAERRTAEDEALAAVTDDMSYEAVSSAIRELDDRHAISYAFRVPASRDLRQMHVYFKNTILMDQMSGGSPRVTLTPWFIDVRNVQSVAWEPGEDVTAVIARLDREIESVNLTPSMVWDPTILFATLRASLSSPLTPSGEQSPRLRGPLLELLNDEWALTDEGLESSDE